MARDPNVSGGGMVVLDHLTDPNSDARQALGRAFGPLAWGRTFVLLGNSRIFLETASNGQQKQQRGIFTWANQRLGQRCQVLNYAGVSGDKLSLMPARYATDVAAYAPKVVLIADAVNDISAGATPTQVQGYYTDLITLNRSIGARTVLLTTNPSNAHTTAAQAVLAATNRWLKSLTDPDILVIDVTSVIAADTGLAWAPGFSTDGLHQSRRGAARMGRVVAAALDPLIPRWDLLPATAGDPANGVPNPLMSGTTGTGVPTGWSVFPAQGTGVTYSLVARTDQRPGNWFQADTTAAAADVFMTSTAPLAGVAAAGDYVEAVVEVDSDAWTAVAGNVRLVCRLLDASNAVAATVIDGHYISTSQVGDTGDTTAYPLENQPGLGGTVVLRTPRVPVPGNATQIKFEFEFNGQGRVRLGRAAAGRAA
jgi:lysophospholipase L1-like esterase